MNNYGAMFSIQALSLNLKPPSGEGNSCLINILYTLHAAGVLPDFTATSVERLMSEFGAAAAVSDRDLKIPQVVNAD